MKLPWVQWEISRAQETSRLTELELRRSCKGVDDLQDEGAVGFVGQSIVLDLRGPQRQLVRWEPHVKDDDALRAANPEERRVSAQRGQGSRYNSSPDLEDARSRALAPQCLPDGGLQAGEAEASWHGASNGAEAGKRGARASHASRSIGMTVSSARDDVVDEEDVFEVEGDGGARRSEGLPHSAGDQSVSGRPSI